MCPESPSAIAYPSVRRDPERAQRSMPVLEILSFSLPSKNIDDMKTGPKRWPVARTHAQQRLCRDGRVPRDRWVQAESTQLPQSTAASSPKYCSSELRGIASLRTSRAARRAFASPAEAVVACGMVDQRPMRTTSCRPTPSTLRMLASRPARPVSVIRFDALRRARCAKSRTSGLSRPFRTR